MTKVVKLFNDMDLATHILQMVQRNWKEQYKFMEATVPQSIHKLLKTLERIKMVFPTDKECKGSHSSARGGVSSKK